MNNKLWGSLADDSDTKKDVTRADIILPESKCKLLFQIQKKPPSKPAHKLIAKNAMVTQTIEVMNQSDMIQSLMDKCSDRSNYNYVFNPCQGLSNLEFSPDSAENLLDEGRFAKPFWFVHHKETKFTKGCPKPLPRVTKPIVDSAIKKSLCGLLKISGYNDTTESALNMFTEAIDHFYKTFMEYINDVILHKGLTHERSYELDVMTLERAYSTMTENSLTCLHNYYKNEIILKNKNEIKEFKDLFQEYDKLMQENQKASNIKQENFNANLLDCSSTSQDANVHSLDNENTDFKDILYGLGEPNADHLLNLPNT